MKIHVLSVSPCMTFLSRPRPLKDNKQIWSSFLGIFVVVRTSKHLTWICSFAYQEGFVTKYLAVNSWDFVMPCCVNMNRYSNNEYFQYLLVLFCDEGLFSWRFVSIILATMILHSKSRD